jgi:ribonuclease P protein component
MSPAEGPARGRRGRISRSRDFDAVYRRGRSAAGRHLVVYAFPREDANDGSPTRLGLSVSRKVGDAVIRNRIKRVLREEFARRAPGVPADLDVVVIARPGCSAYLDEHGSTALGARLGELLERAVGAARSSEAGQPDAA